MKKLKCPNCGQVFQVDEEGVSKCTPSVFYAKAPTFTSWGFVIT